MNQTANITLIESLDNTLANLKLLAIKLDKDVISTIKYCINYIYSSSNHEFHLLDVLNDEDFNDCIESLINELNQDEYEVNRHDVELGDNGEW